MTRSGLDIGFGINNKIRSWHPAVQTTRWGHDIVVNTAVQTTRWCHDIVVHTAVLTTRWGHDIVVHPAVQTTRWGHDIRLYIRLYKQDEVMTAGCTSVCTNNKMRSWRCCTSGCTNDKPAQHDAFSGAFCHSWLRQEGREDREEEWPAFLPQIK